MQTTLQEILNKVVSCPFCDGTGIVFKEHVAIDCRACVGRGTISRYRIAEIMEQELKQLNPH